MHALIHLPIVSLQPIIICIAPECNGFGNNMHPASQIAGKSRLPRASVECLSHLPDTMIINGQADVLRSEGEAFVKKLRCAGVDVTALQIQGTIHDFVMLNALDQTEACRIAMDASIQWINRKKDVVSFN